MSDVEAMMWNLEKDPFLSATFGSISILDRPLDSSRVVKVDHVSAHKVGSVVEVRAPGDVDDELRRWLREAYGLGALAARTSH